VSAWAKYHEALLKVHRNNGAPSSRAIRDAAPEATSHSTVNDVLRGKRLPSWRILKNVLDGIGAGPGAIAHMNELWQEAHLEVGGRLPAEDPPPIPTAPPPMRAWESAVLEELRAIRDLLEKITRSGYDI